MLPTFRAAATALILVATFSAPSAVVQPNDNRSPAGEIRGDTLHLRLVVQMASWRPEKDDGPVIDVPAFGEEGEAPRVPAPLIRVREGTVLDITIRNTLPDSNLVVLGMTTHPSPSGTAIVRPGESRHFVFASGAAGTYMYRARVGVPGKNVENSQLAGAFIVDPKEGSPPDRVFVVNIWGHQIDSTHFTNALTINGRSWPSTERIDAVVGDTLHWRVINPTGRPHPMHLHGAYFRVDGRGTEFLDTTYTPDQRRLVVTEVMQKATTMSIVWSPLNPGRWLFHCHLMFHVVPPDAVVDQTPGKHDEHSVDPTEHMAGLVLGIDARMRPGVMQAGRAKARQLDLYVQEGPKRARAARSMSFILQQGRTPPRPDSILLPGSMLVLTRGEPTDVTVHNRMTHPTAVHWHGLELESFSDGVAGWGGSAAMPSPPIQPGATFTARLSMPRAGTFIYHTHLRDGEQLTSGLYGPIIVLEPGTQFDPRKDHVHIMSWDSMDNTQGLVNGDSTSSPAIEMRLGETHRFRFINIGAADAGDFTLKRDTTLAEWRPVAKDGAELLPSRRVIQPAAVSVDVGETYDFEFTPKLPGEYVLSAPNGSVTKKWERKVIVR